MSVKVISRSLSLSLPSFFLNLRFFFLVRNDWKTFDIGFDIIQRIHDLFNKGIGRVYEV